MFERIDDVAGFVFSLAAFPPYSNHRAVQDSGVPFRSVKLSPTPRIV